MIKNSMNLKLILLCYSLLASCVTIHKGNFFPSAVISKGNFKTIGFAEGESVAIYLVGLIGGLSREGLVREAKIDLYNKANLQKNQTIANVTLDVETTFLAAFILVSKKVIIRGDIIEFTDSNDIEIGTNDQKEMPAIENLPYPAQPVADSYLGFSVGDSVHFKQNFSIKKGVVKGWKPPNFIVEFDDDGVKKTATIFNNRLHKHP